MTQDVQHQQLRTAIRADIPLHPLAEENRLLSQRAAHETRVISRGKDFIHRDGRGISCNDESRLHEAGAQPVAFQKKVLVTVHSPEVWAYLKAFLDDNNIGVNYADITDGKPRIDLLRTFEAVNAVIASYNSTSEGLRYPLRNTHAATARRMYDIYVDGHKTGAAYVRSNVMSNAFGEPRACPAFQTNGGALNAQLFQRDQRTIDAHIERLSKANILARLTYTANKIRSQGASEELIILNPDLVIFVAA
jgi:hypothetical protein